MEKRVNQSTKAEMSKIFRTIISFISNVGGLK